MVGLSACASPLPGVGLAPGFWTLAPVPAPAVDGRTPLSPIGGWIEVPDGGGPPRIELAGALLLTAEGAAAQVSGPAAGDGENVRWLHVPVQTPMGEGEAALRLDGQRARLPVGGRPGELDQDLRIDAGAPPEGWAETRAAAADRVRAWSETWARGQLELVDADGRAVGDLAFFDDGGVLIDVYDASWSTDGPQAAQRADDGADLMLAVPIEPSLDGEGALLRVNLIQAVVVVPSAGVPQPEDRWLQLRAAPAGGVSAAARAERHAAAAAAALQAEALWMRDALPKLAAALQSPVGCRPISAVDEAWPLLLKGYGVEIIEGPTGCEVHLEPKPPQHGRRTRARARADGWIHLEPVSAVSQGDGGLVEPPLGR